MEPEKTTKGKSREGREKGGQRKEGQKQQKQDSVWVARELILGDELGIGRRLLDFRQIKNQNYQKFSQRVYHNLKSKDFDFDSSVQRFIAISCRATDENTTGHQMGALLAGFDCYWKESQVGLEGMLDLFEFVEQVYAHVGRKMVTICRELIEAKLPGQKDKFLEQAQRMAKKLMKSKKLDEKVLPLIAEFDLYGKIPSGDIVDLVLRANNVGEVQFVFWGKKGEVRLNLLRVLVDRCVGAGGKGELSKCETLMRGLKVDPFQFGNYISKMQERYISYLVRTYKLYYIELIIAHDRNLLLLLVEQLSRMRRQHQMHYFVLKYQLFPLQLTNAHRQTLLNLKNILLHRDFFGPTEVEVLEQIADPLQEDAYLYLSDLGISQQDVLLIDSSNIDSFDFQKTFCGKVGIDEERAGGTHVFDPPQTSLLQIFNGRQVFIFDIEELGDHKKLREAVEHIMRYCHIYGQQILKELTGMQRSMGLEIEQKVMQELMRQRVTESNKLFKQVYPKEKKSSLAYLCDFLFGKTLSKYEQCSGWKRRPLRKAQIHYAALDCVLPYLICEELLIRAKVSH